MPAMSGWRSTIPAIALRSAISTRWNVKPGRERESREARFLQLDVVIVVQIVDADDRIAPSEQRFGDVGSDESGRSGDEDRHDFGACA